MTKIEHRVIFILMNEAYDIYDSLFVIKTYIEILKANFLIFFCQFKHIDIESLLNLCFTRAYEYLHSIEKIMILLSLILSFTCHWVAWASIMIYSSYRNGISPLNLFFSLVSTRYEDSARETMRELMAYFAARSTDKKSFSALKKVNAATSSHRIAIKMLPFKCITALKSE